jgi:hypothetical protein
MIELVAAEHDDAEFLTLAQRITNGAIAALQVREAYLVHIDNWFDFKWLRWRRTRENELRVPPFSPNRVLSEKHFAWDVQESAWVSIGLQKPLNYWQAGGSWHAMSIDRLAERATFIWYSGNTTTNKVGSLMLYLSGAGGYAWYASFRKDEHWSVVDECEITRRELESFAERGHELEAVEAQSRASLPETHRDDADGEPVDARN